MVELSRAKVVLVLVVTHGSRSVAAGGYFSKPAPAHNEAPAPRTQPVTVHDQPPRGWTNPGNLIKGGAAAVGLTAAPIAGAVAKLAPHVAGAPMAAINPMLTTVTAAVGPALSAVGAWAGVSSYQQLTDITKDQKMIAERQRRQDQREGKRASKAAKRADQPDQRKKAAERKDKRTAAAEQRAKGFGPLSRHPDVLPGRVPRVEPAAELKRIRQDMHAQRRDNEAQQRAQNRRTIKTLRTARKDANARVKKKDIAQGVKPPPTSSSAETSTASSSESARSYFSEGEARSDSSGGSHDGLNARRRENIDKLQAHRKAIGVPSPGDKVDVGHELRREQRIPKQEALIKSLTDKVGQAHEPATRKFKPDTQAYDRFVKSTGGVKPPPLTLGEHPVDAGYHGDVDDPRPPKPRNVIQKVFDGVTGTRSEASAGSSNPNSANPLLNNRRDANLQNPGASSRGAPATPATEREMMEREMRRDPLFRARDRGSTGSLASVEETGEGMV